MCISLAAQVLQDLTSTDHVLELAKRVVVNYVWLPRIVDDEDCDDKVYVYTTELATLWHGFHAAIREGDGERILRYWKFLLVVKY